MKIGPLIACMAAMTLAASAQETTTLRPVADTFVLNPGLGNTNHTNAAIYNYGGAGSRSVASANAYAYQEVDGVVIINHLPKGEFISLLQFDFSELAGQPVTAIDLQLYISNGNQSAFGIFNYLGSPGDFDLSWISNEWEQGTGAPHELPSNSLNGISYTGLQELLAADPARWMDVFYYTAENEYGDPQWFTFTFDLTNGYYADLLQAVTRGETVTFMLSASEDSTVAFNFAAYVQLGENGANLRPEGPILTVTTQTDDEVLPRIENCYTDVVVSGQTDTGGLVGLNASDVRSCYAAGSIVADISDPNLTIGGLFGEGLGRAQNCVWDVETSGISELSDEAALATAAMMQQESFTSWDFSADDGDAAVWMMLRPGQDYPRLAWQEIIVGDIAGFYGVSLADVTALASCWLTAPVDDCLMADINGDEKVNLTDFAMLAAHWLAGQ